MKSLNKNRFVDTGIKSILVIAAIGLSFFVAPLLVLKGVFAYYLYIELNNIIIYASSKLRERKDYV